MKIKKRIVFKSTAKLSLYPISQHGYTDSTASLHREFIQLVSEPPSAAKAQVGSVEELLLSPAHSCSVLYTYLVSCILFPNLFTPAALSGVSQ